MVLMFVVCVRFVDSGADFGLGCYCLNGGCFFVGSVSLFV